MRSKDEIYSIELVKEFFHYIGKTTSESSEKYASYDLIVYNDINDLRYIEVKNRRLTPEQFNKYAPYGFLIEKLKYNFLKEHNGFYVNTINFGSFEVIISWYIGKGGIVISDFENNILPSKTDFENSTTITKQVSYLPLDKAEIIIKDNCWIASNTEELFNKVNYN